ncbi:hypothetical protein ACLQ29_32840 [Micromonospora sp. DT228]|uniref:hypothetical protein n=1 Tax=Micromonospora sp. DT228 TaxID=3393443 RepID=UPI003CF569A4
MAASLILPVGRYTGEFHPAVGAPVRYHSLSIGRLSVTIEDPQALAVWAAAHRAVDRPDATWDRAAVIDAATRLGVTNPDRIVAEFLEDGLLVETAPGAPEVEDFARTHRVHPLMVSLGNSPDDPLRYGIGLFGTAPVLRLPALAHDVWQWSSVGASLWDVCQAFADAGAQAEVADTREHDPRHVLREFLAALPLLVGANAACLDEARR